MNSRVLALVFTLLVCASAHAATFTKSTQLSPGSYGDVVLAGSGGTLTVGSKGGAQLSSLVVQSSGWTVDGTCGTASKLGIKIGPPSGLRVVTIANGADNTVLKYVELEHRGLLRSTSDDAIYAVSGNNGGSTGIHLSHCYVHDASRTLWLSYFARNVEIDNCYFARVRGDGTHHTDMVSVNSSGDAAGWSIHDNTFEDASGTGYIVIKDSVQGGFDIYRNKFTQTADWKGAVAQGPVTNTAGDTNSDTRVVGNVFTNIKVRAALLFTGSGTSNTASGNVWNNCKREVIGFTDADVTTTTASTTTHTVP